MRTARICTRIGGMVLVAVLLVTTAWAQNEVYSFPMDDDPGWAVEGDWAFGVPTGGGGSSGGPDPASGYTGENVYGYNLNGDYPNYMDETLWLTTKALDFTGYTEVQLHFQRWLGVEAICYDEAWIEVSSDGVNWVEVWHNPDG
ncbi:MAG: hypothetical protein KKB50_12875 [Planctomycetes bacterium]|nr:hypothetical protein [Planctomycetota bacterium]